MRPVPSLLVSRPTILRRFLRQLALTAALLICGPAFIVGLISGAAQAMPIDPVQQHNSNALWFENWTGLSKATLVVAGPDGSVTRVFAEAGTPVFELGRGEVLDGVYRYELKAATEETVKIVNPIDNGRGESSNSRAKPFYMNGAFQVSRGVIIVPEDIREE
ncbi:hypothetical protein PXK17_17640 [Phaeobacter gallaeciensis]|uniref:Uncharacterized protein n=1 Tax=Phaeobacter gallaeciensis TaxID=60890 RepID=A0ABD4XDS8_9RHOB|nr:hypothetical protein [Phaeobacter gallaeciensis]MDE4146510.1 hypothetical protein [Phaeobacter gallaeciensis]MDE4159126.1 hypothetical protein [Phaeobacter gallaeciensis]MDE4163303.1 hypothetical protein [Phaeobacter gallaeciensis]MDE4167590.1 hypothetical protein [Phaeobacter gallaeciensis]MDE4171824.1 hypothetical protein [Phaeobacter gallaeciensis]